MAVGSLLIIGGIGGIVFWGGFNTFMEHTNTLGFCTGCHEMDTVYQEYTQSVHYENNSGVRAICSDCHVPKPWTAKLVRKIEASNEIYHKFIGSIDTPEKFEAKRLELANNVWRSMKKTDSRECRNCHAFDTMTVGNQRNDARFWHPMAIDEEFTCIDCHKGIAHHLPDLESLVKEARKSFVNSFVKNSMPGSQVYTMTLKQLLAEPDATASVVARLSPVVRLTIQERTKGWLRVVLEGQEVLGDASQLYTEKMLGIVAAEVFVPLEYTSEESTLDNETRLSWRGAKVVGWVSDEELSSGFDESWIYAKTLYENECARCHAVFPPSAMKAGEWANSIRNMRRYTKLSENDLALVLRYLQQNGKALSDI
jgi:trimethylamine-N-oxide reductase cytochrome c-type subunit TorC